MIFIDSTGAASEVRQDTLSLYLYQLERNKTGKRAAHIALSQLDPNIRRPVLLRVASEGLCHLAQSGCGRLFRLVNSDLLFFYEAADGRRVKAELNRLVNLLSGESLTAIDENTWTFGRVYDLAREFDEITKISRCHECGSCDDTPVDPGQGNPIKLRLKRRDAIKRAVPPNVLPQLEQLLARTDIANFIRLRSVCQMLPTSPPQSIFTEASISLPALSQAIVPGYDLAADRFITRFLARTLDKKLLNMLLRRELKAYRNQIAIHICFETLQSSVFKHFDDKISISYRGSVIFKIQIADIIEDISAAKFLLRLARYRGYRIILSGINFYTLSLLDFDGLPIDYVDFDSPPDTHVKSPNLGPLSDAWQRIAPAQMILAGIDTHDMLVQAANSGIELLQGSAVEKALSDGRWPAQPAHAS